MIVRVEGLNLLPGATELLDQCVDDVDEDGDASESWQDILQSLWKPSPIDVGHAHRHPVVEDETPRAPLARLSHDDAHDRWNN